MVIVMMIRMMITAITMIFSSCSVDFGEFRELVATAAEAAVAADMTASKNILDSILKAVHVFTQGGGSVSEGAMKILKNIVQKRSADSEGEFSLYNFHCCAAKQQSKCCQSVNQRRCRGFRCLGGTTANIYQLFEGALARLGGRGWGGGGSGGWKFGQKHAPLYILYTVS